MRTFYKLAKSDGWDFYTGKTINYRDNLDKTVSIKDIQRGYKLCSNSVIHASRNPNQCFIGASIPCSAYKVEGIPVIEDSEKAGFVALKILEEIIDLDNLFSWNYSEAVNPIHPFKIKSSKITKAHIDLIKSWASVWASVGDSVGDSVRDSVGDSVRASVWDSVRASVWASVGASVGVYIGSLFPQIETWKYIDHKRGIYPFQSVVDLWKQGLVPSFSGKLWRLHSGPNGQVIWEAEL